MIKRAWWISLVALACVTSTQPDDDDATPRDDGGDAPRSGVVLHDAIEYSGDVAVMESFPVQLRGRVTITNRGSQGRTITFPDGCVALLRAYRPGESEPVWDQSSELACTMALVPVTLAAGESSEVSTPTASAADILDDRLPDGEYRIAIYLRPDGDEVEIDGGTVDLAIPR
jgi:hypothetical protein